MAPTHAVSPELPRLQIALLGQTEKGEVEMKIEITELEADCIAKALGVMAGEENGWLGERLRASKRILKKISPLLPHPAEYYL